MDSDSRVPNSGTILGQIVDLHTRSIYPGELTWLAGRIEALRPVAHAPERYILPGFVDAHVHIESSMLTPSEFARRAVVHGTVATVSDPHEIANVLGTEGIEFMLRDAEKVPLKIHFGVPSCVPATAFETAGAKLDADDVARLLDDPRLNYLSEMMNYPGVLLGDMQVLGKIGAAKSRGKRIDGHAPGLRGEAARGYFAAGITTDHECTSLDEAREKRGHGVWIQIREGSAARNFAALWPLLQEQPEGCMFCTDDLHPDDLQLGHIDRIAARAITHGVETIDVLRAACQHPVTHYGLNVGLLRLADPADFIVVKDLQDLRVQETYIDGRLVAREGVCQWTSAPGSPINRFAAASKSPSDFRLPARSGQIRVLVATDGSLATQVAIEPTAECEGLAIPDVGRDLLKITVVNRYANLPPSVAFVRGFGLKRGALASSVAHDCHNVVAVGTNDDALAEAINAVIEMKGGLAAVGPGEHRVLALPVAGLMSTEDCEHVAAAYLKLNALARNLGSSLRAPFMTMSFMALLVIPKLKLSDRGLFDGDQFQFVDCFC